jgi:hypothetical protein
MIGFETKEEDRDDIIMAVIKGGRTSWNHHGINHGQMDKPVVSSAERRDLD